MTAPAPLTRTLPAAPVRLLHLGLGNFFRAHPAWYTDVAADADRWGYAAFDGRSPGLARAMAPQGGVYTLVVRDADHDESRVVSSISAVHAADDHAAWAGYWADPELRIVTVTVTEAGYRVDPAAGAAEVAALRRGETSAVTTAIGRLVAGALVRRAAGAGGIVLLPCDNLPGNGGVLRDAVARFAAAVDPGLWTWIEQNVTFGSTMVDRITPATTPELVAEVTALTGRYDAAPVASEPFREWVIACDFPRGRPAWDATFVSDVLPYEQRKLWLLNGSHSLLAYAGLLRGHASVADAMGDGACRAWIEEWWDEASRHLSLEAADIAEYRRELVRRFTNPRIRHELAQISADGSEKIRARILPTVRAERAAGRVPSAAARVLGSWVAFLSWPPVPVRDPQADTLARLASGTDPKTRVRGLLAFLGADLGGDDELVAEVAAHVDAFGPGPGADG